MRWFEKKWPALLFFPLSLLYGGVTALRNVCYDIGVFKRLRVDCPVISVGNITVGGTGKTPTVQMLVHVLLNRGKRPVIISRGYGRKSKGTVIVSDGRKVIASAAEAGDEPLMLAQNCRGAAVIVDADRVRAAKLAIERFQPDAIVLDDGFQHRRLARDLDIVVVRGKQPFGNGFCLPAGPLREPLTSLARADLLLVTGAEKEPLPINASLPTVKARYEMIDCISASGKAIAGRDLAGKRAVAFCGLGNPNNFYQMMQSAGVNLCRLLTFNDHHSYAERDLDMINKTAQDNQAELILTTEKDWVKLESARLDERWMRVRMVLEVDDLLPIMSRFEKII